VARSAEPAELETSEVQSTPEAPEVKPADASAASPLDPAHDQQQPA